MFPMGTLFICGARYQCLCVDPGLVGAIARGQLNGAMASVVNASESFTEGSKMPNKTDAEWRELDEQLAREVMGRRKWDDIPEPDRKELRERQDGGFDYLAAGFSASEYEAFCLATHRDFWWERYSEHGWTHAYDCRGWQPHLDVTQAMDVLEALSQKGINYSITRFAKHEIIVQLWGYLRGRFCVRRQTGRIVRRTICLAIEQRLDAQKEKQEK